MAYTVQEKLMFYSTITFRYLLDALARPGKIVYLDEPHLLGPFPRYRSDKAAQEVPLNRYALGAMLTLLDREVGFLLAANNQWLPADAPASRWLALRSGSSATRPDSAAFVLFCDGQSNGLLSELHKGTFLEPENAATAWYCVEHIEDGSEQTHKHTVINLWQTLELSGPGIETTNTIRVAGLSQQEIEHIHTTRQHYPLGIDIYLIDTSGRCIGLPRTTRIQARKG